LVITATPLTKVLGTADPLLTYTAAGLLDSQSSVLSGALARDPGETIGNYTVNNGTLALNSSNYTYDPAVNFVPCQFTILAPTVVQEITQSTLTFSNTPMVTGNIQLSHTNTEKIALMIDASNAGSDKEAVAEPATAEATPASGTADKADKAEAAEEVAVVEASANTEAVVTKTIPVCR
jgi:hypothetical protein